MPNVTKIQKTKKIAPSKVPANTPTVQPTKKKPLKPKVKK